jgi:N-glycosylase/DNA lyase
MEVNEFKKFEIKSTHLDLKKINDSGQILMGWSELTTGGYHIVSAGKKAVAVQLSDGIELKCKEEDKDFWCHYFDMETDYAAMESKFPEDEFLQKALEFGKGIRILNQNLWEALFSFIVSQNNNIPRITKTIKLIQGDRKTFPTAQELYKDRANLSACGLGYRDKYLIRLLEDLNDGRLKLDFDEDTDKARKQLMSIYGIGLKVANCVLLFGMHKMDCCPVDTWMKKIFENHYGGKAPDWTKDINAGYYQQVTFFYERSGNR